MTHIEIYKKLELLEEEISQYIDENCVGLQSEVCAFQLTMARMTWTEILKSLNIFETNKLFCMSCFYLCLKSLTQGITRYMNFESPEGDGKDSKFFSDYCYLENIYNDLKNLVIQISYLAVNQDECKRIKNTAYSELKGKTSKRELRYNDDEDDDDDDFKLN
jgi:hypothetical protein